MTLLQIHQKAIEDQKYNGVTTRFSGYIQFGEIRDENHDLIGYSPAFIKKVIECIKSTNYLYARQKNGYVSLYGKDDTQ